MHEFGSVQEAIRKLRTVNPPPKSVRISLGKMRGSAKGFLEMFLEHTRETELDGIKVEMVSIPVEIKCKCGLEGPVRIIPHVHFVRCPMCGEVADVVKGNELDIEIVQ